MKTYNGKSISKKSISAILRTMDATKIFGLFARIHGWVPGRHAVYDFIRNYAPSNKVYRAAYRIAYDARKHYYDSDLYKGKHGYYKPLPRQAARQYLQHEKDRGFDNYTKVAMYGNTWLYACSPVYGHHDYNKARILEIKGNERYCEILVKKYGQNTLS